MVKFCTVWLLLAYSLTLTTKKSNGGSCFDSLSDKKTDFLYIKKRYLISIVQVGNFIMSGKKKKLKKKNLYLWRVLIMSQQLQRLIWLIKKRRFYIVRRSQWRFLVFFPLDWRRSPVFLGLVDKAQKRIHPILAFWTRCWTTRLETSFFLFSLFFWPSCTQGLVE